MYNIFLQIVGCKQWYIFMDESDQVHLINYILAKSSVTLR